MFYSCLCNFVWLWKDCDPCRLMAPEGMCSLPACVKAFMLYFSSSLMKFTDDKKKRDQRMKTIELSWFYTTLINWFCFICTQFIMKFNYASSLSKLGFIVIHYSCLSTEFLILTQQIWKGLTNNMLGTRYTEDMNCILDLLVDSGRNNTDMFLLRHVTYCYKLFNRPSNTR